MGRDSTPTKIIKSEAMFSKCSVDCNHSGKNVARHSDNNTDVEFCRTYLVAEKALKSDLRVSMSVTRYKSQTKVRTAEAMSCSRSSVKADEVNNCT
jgi:hypothetical protein